MNAECKTAKLGFAELILYLLVVNSGIGKDKN